MSDYARNEAAIRSLTARHAKVLLRQSRSVLDTSLDAGLSRPGRLHDLMLTVDGVTPGEFKQLGSGITIRYGFHETPFGTGLIGITERGICHMSFMDIPKDKALLELRKTWKNATFVRDQAATGKTMNALFGRKPLKKRMRVFAVGTPFQLKVWEAALRIPPGHVLSYQDVARLAGNPGASRAVGSALGRNSVCYAIPCHRVIRDTGVVGEYRWGRARKQAMLAWEQVTISSHSPR